MYFIILQIYTFLFLYEHYKKKGVFIQLFKYFLLLIYIFSGNIIGLLGKFQETNGYHIHHWILSIFFILLIDIHQPYYTMVQYLNYAIYIHGVAMYGYDAIIK